jgi:predicted RNase H-like HicB family nuclease
MSSLPEIPAGRIIVERHPDGYVAYPRDFNGVVIGAGDSADEAMADLLSALRFHIETFGNTGSGA